MVTAAPHVDAFRITMLIHACKEAAALRVIQTPTAQMATLELEILVTITVFVTIRKFRIAVMEGWIQTNNVRVRATAHLVKYAADACAELVLTVATQIEILENSAIMDLL